MVDEQIVDDPEDLALQRWEDELGDEDTEDLEEEEVAA